MPKCDIYHGDVMDGLRSIPSDSVQCVVTSPPYWSLRDYGEEGQIGLESTFQEFQDNMIEVFREVRRVLRPDGTLWLNFGDSFAASGVKGGGGKENYKAFEPRRFDFGSLKTKDLMGMPWRIAFALQDDGWWLRSDIIWHKSSCLPESVTDRPTRTHEYVFLMTKSPRYFFDIDAIREDADKLTKRRDAFRTENWVNNKAFYNYSDSKTDDSGLNYKAFGRNPRYKAFGRNPRSVWRMSNRYAWRRSEANFKSTHPVVFPVDLVFRCLKAGTSEHGACASCGAPYERVVDSEHLTTGWRSTCRCKTKKTKPCIVLDPFFGLGTTGVVAFKLGQDCIGIEISKKYVDVAKNLIRTTNPLGADVRIRRPRVQIRDSL